jgi:hypothetical protein
MWVVAQPESVRVAIALKAMIDFIMCTLVILLLLNQGVVLT